jgi:ABC-type multidrug transport system fused ATPase/permease subunit
MLHGAPSRPSGMSSLRRCASASSSPGSANTAHVYTIRRIKKELVKTVREIVVVRDCWRGRARASDGCHAACSRDAPASLRRPRIAPPAASAAARSHGARDRHARAHCVAARTRPSGIAPHRSAPRTAPHRSDARMTVAVELRDLRADFEQQPGLSEISLGAERGDTLGIASPSGVNKTTLLCAIAGLTPVARGAVHVLGRDVTTLPPKHRRAVYLHQHPVLFPSHDGGREHRVPAAPAPDARIAIVTSAGLVAPAG